MKLSEYIEGLQTHLDKHGDLECYYARDPEGNGYHPVNYNGSVASICKTDENNWWIEDIYNEEELDDLIEDGYLDEDDVLIPIFIIN